MLVFIRKSLMPYNQSYRKCIKANKNKEEAEAILEKTLPEMDGAER